jgi:hypothetical protein
LLEDLLPQNNFYRHLEATLDLSFVRDWTRELYAERSRPSIDPVSPVRARDFNYPWRTSNVAIPCITCRTELPDEAIYCSKCGRQI